MKPVFRSILTAAVIALAIEGFTVGVVAPRLPGVAGHPDFQEERLIVRPGVPLLRLRNADGAIQVRATDRSDISVAADISACVRRELPLEAARSYVATLVQVTEDANTLSIQTEPAERPDNLRLRVDYAVEIPLGTDLEVDSANGNIWVSKGCGRVTARGRNTDIEVVEPRGVVLAESTNGRLRVLDAPEDVSLKTVNGNVYAHMLGGTLTASTSNGGIVARVLRPTVRQCRLTSHNGGITVILNDGCSARVDAKTALGKVRCDLPVETANGARRRRFLCGVIGEGKTVVEADTLNGNVWIARAD
ncbi:MAG: hypothetical protein HY706_01580 [Candidatus Hydrogenedentes bacterium]|nr:hypothetical protein [Candidatus Hydrogenedentota bacterium]